MTATWRQCGVSGDALVDATDLPSGVSYTLRVPWQHRHTSIGWGSRPRYRWEGGVGILAAEGDEGVTVMDEHGVFHQVPHDGVEALELGNTAPSVAAIVPPDLEGEDDTDEQELAKGKALKPGQRWITVHPNGHDEKGVPVLIEEAGDGTHRVIAGAGGKLTHLRLDKVGSEEEHKEKARERSKEKRAKEKERKAAQSDEERETEQAAKADLEAKKLLVEREFINRVRDKVGGVDADLDEEALARAIPTKGGVSLVMTRHHKKQLRQAIARKDALLEQLVDQQVDDATHRAAIQRKLHDESPEIASEVSELAEHELELRRIEDEERRAERRQNRSRQTSGKTEVGDKAAQEVAETLESIDDPSERLRVLGGRDDGIRPQDAGVRAGMITPSQELDRRALQALQDAKLLHDVAQGREPQGLAKKVADRALQRAGLGEDADDDTKAAALQREAARQLRRSEIQQMRADKLRELEAEDGVGRAQAALRFADSLTGIVKDASDAKRLGLTEAEKTPLQEAEIADIYDLLADAKALRKAQQEFAAVTEAVEGGEYDKSRRAFELKVDDRVDEKVRLSVEEEVQRELTERLLGMASSKRGSMLQSVAVGHYDSLADVGLALGKERFLDRPTVDALGVKNSAILLRHALEESGSLVGDTPAARASGVLEALESHHVESLTRLSADAIARAEEYVPGMEANVASADDLELALGQLDAHNDAIDEAQRVVGAAIGKLEATATLSQAYRERLPDVLAVPTGGDFQTGLQWLHSVGLKPGDYRLDHENKQIVIPKAAWGKLIRHDSPEMVEGRKKAAAIKSGELDEDGWLPEGFARRPASTFNAPTREAAPLAQPLTLPEVEAPLVGGGGPTPREQLFDRLIGSEPPKENPSLGMFGGGGGENPDWTRWSAQRSALLAGDRDAALETIAGMRDSDPEKWEDWKQDFDAILDASHATEPAGGADGDLGERMHQALHDHVGSRLADGQSPSAIQQDLLSPEIQASLTPEQAGAYKEAMDRLFPMTRDAEGRLQKFTADPAHYEAIARAHMEQRFGEQGGFHAQGIDVDHPATREAVYRTLSEHPEAKLAFKPTGQLTATERHQLRREFYRLAGIDPDTKREQRNLTIEDALGPEPDRENRNLSMFGGPVGDNPDWTRWHKQREALDAGHWRKALELADHPGGRDGAEEWERDGYRALTQRLKDYDSDRIAGGGGTAWSDYVAAHGSQELATQALQDELKSEFARTFRDHHSRTTDGEPLRLGVAEITNSEAHQRAMSTSAGRRQARRQRSQEMAGLRKREGGRFAAMGGEGSARDAFGRMLDERAANGQTQASMLSARPSRAEPGPGERHTLGQRTEAQIASLVNGELGAGFEPGTPVGLFPDASMDGDRIHQQRVIKMARHNGGRVGGYLGVGAGKTATSIGMFTDRHAAGEATHGLFVVPPAVLEQFGGEMAAFVEPGKHSWRTSSGMSHDERVAMLQDKGTHMRVITHQSYRDTVLRLAAEHQGTSVAKVKAALRAASPKERAQMVRDALGAKGIPNHMVYWDEAHMGVERDGTDPSGVSLIQQATTHPINSAGGMLLGTATPAKNDESELRSMAAMLHPDTYGDRHAFMQAFGSSEIAPDAIRRELAGSTYSMSIPPKGVTRTDSDNPRIEGGRKVRGDGPLHLEPEHQKLVDAVHAAYDKARRARNAGSVDVDAMRELSPHGFDLLPEADHEAHARKLSESLGIIRESALRRAINQAPPEVNTKLKALTDVVLHDVNHATWTDRAGKEHRGKPSIVFTNSLREARMIHEHLTKQGVRAGLYHGGLNQDEREKVRNGFKPPKGQPRTHDVVVMTGAGEAGINMQTAKAVHHYDVPMTEKSHNQRSGRAYRQGQEGDVDVHNWHTATEYEDRAMRRLKRKTGLASVFQSNIGSLDEHGVAASYQRVTTHKHQARDLGLLPKKGAA